MTRKTVTCIQIKDIAAVEFECGTCHTKVSYPLDKFIHPLTACNVCQPPKQFIVYGSNEFAEWNKFAELLKRFSKNGDNFIFRFELLDEHRKADDRV